MKGKKILLGITGSIAAYKSAILVRILVKAGAEVKVVMTEAAKEFVGPLTFSVLSKKSVASQFANRVTGEWTNHVELGLWADVVLIAPASANTIAKMATGVCDNLLLAVYLSSRCPVFVAPAMDLDMLRHPATAANIEKLKSWSHRIITPAFGELASGLTGDGRMEEPENIFRALEDFFSVDLPLKNKKALVSAGPTYEDIDPVRFIGNRSSGKMGFAIAAALAEKGADVTLVSGPTDLILENNSIERYSVRSAYEMYNACTRLSVDKDIIVMSAAVADYTPANPSKEKIKKKNNSLSIPLVPTDDILAEIGKHKKSGQMLVGFALETNNELENAREKLKKKNLDLIVLNSLNDAKAGFSFDTNKITIIDRNLETREFPLKSKKEVAADIVNAIVDYLKKI